MPMNSKRLPKLWLLPMQLASPAIVIYAFFLEPKLWVLICCFQAVGYKSPAIVPMMYDVGLRANHHTSFLVQCCGALKIASSSILLNSWNACK